ncbi:MAG: insulinase family protein, partial [Chloroflexi bacterium]|nr:insulinase family protein [Chloroflexota bacterium]
MTSQTKDSISTFQKTTLDNGLRIVTSEMPHTRAVSINIYIGVGSRYETPEQAGISHFIEHMVFKGTERRPTPFEISATI